MPKRLHILAGGVLTAALVVGGALELLRPFPPRFTRDMASRIHPGMTEQEVVAILGRPAGNYTSRIDWEWVYTPMLLVWQYPEGSSNEDGSTAKGWMSDEAWVAVYFNPDGRVMRCWSEPAPVPAPRSPLDFVRRLLP
jgi:hypothetical protein